MISRVAESCFWLHRYMERVENTARMLDVNRSFIIEIGRPELGSWRPMIIVAGEEPRFLERFASEDLDRGEVVERYLTWDDACPVAIRTSLRWARENARTIREAISQEMWETLNATWLWLESPKGRRLYEQRRYDFYARVKEACLLFHGVCHNTMLHEEAFDFMRLGMHLERAVQTARILDVHHHTLAGASGPPAAGAGAPPAATVDAAEWLAILRSCSARDASFKKTRRPLSGAAVAGFLLLEDAFPRSVRHNVERAWNFLQRVQRRGERPTGERSAAMLDGTARHLRTLDAAAAIGESLHAELTWLIDRLAEVAGAVHEDYFDPKVPSAVP